MAGPLASAQSHLQEKSNLTLLSVNQPTSHKIPTTRVPSFISFVVDHDLSLFFFFPPGLAKAAHKTTTNKQ